MTKKKGGVYKLLRSVKRGNLIKKINVHLCFSTFENKSSFPVKWLHSCIHVASYSSK